jgi:hypothetical protein
MHDRCCPTVRVPFQFYAPSRSMSAPVAYGVQVTFQAGDRRRGLRPTPQAFCYRRRE